MTGQIPAEEPNGFPVRDWKADEELPDKKQATQKGKKKSLTTKQKVKRAMVKITACLAIVTSVTLFGVYRIGKFYEQNTTSLQSPIILQSPVRIEKREIKPAVEPEKPDAEKTSFIPVAKAAELPEKKEPLKPKVAKPVGHTIQMMMYDKVVAKWGEEQWPAMKYIMDKEAGSDPYAKNKSSGACGIPQALPCSKMLNVIGTLDNIDGQLDWMVQYVESRYKNPAGAKAFHVKNNWY